MQGCAYVDGRYVAPEEATISVFDWGFLHSDATYDVAHVWKGRFFRIDAHLDRFFASCAALRLNPGLPRAEVKAVMHECVRRAGLATPTSRCCARADSRRRARATRAPAATPSWRSRSRSSGSPTPTSRSAASTWSSARRTGSRSRASTRGSRTTTGSTS